MENIAMSFRHVASSAVSTRGAARHWVIGCLALIVLVVIGLVAGGVYVWKSFVDMNQFDVSAKVDPPVNASPELIFPPMVAGLERREITSDTLRLQSVQPGQEVGGTSAATSSGTLMAIYANDEAYTTSVVVIAGPTSEMDKQERGGGVMDQMMRQQQMNQGVQMRIKADTPMDFALWSKPNWSYVIFTTSSQALEFAKDLKPAAQ